MIRGIPIVLYDRIQTGTDDFGAPIYTETPVTVENVLVTPSTSDDIVSDLQLYGKKAVYELSIPKGDTHVWEDRKVEFFGAVWHTFGFSRQYIAENVPLSWNAKIKVERYG